jgi:hypothetical protein
VASTAPLLRSAYRKARCVGEDLDRRRRGIPARVDYPWYDSGWLSSYVQAREYLTNRHPEKLEEFETALSVFRTDPGFEPVLLDGLFDEEVLDRIRRTVASYGVDRLEVQELASFGRFVVHDDPYFLELQRGVRELISEAVGEPVDTGYNFLSLYQGDAKCPVHMDAPNAKWTLDICIDQSREWPIHIADVGPWPDGWRAPDADDWAAAIKADSEFTAHTMNPGQAIVFAGSSQWHYRDPMPEATADDFCTLLFFHFVPAGSTALSRPENWAEIFDVPEFRSFCK